MKGITRRIKAREKSKDKVNFPKESCRRRNRILYPLLSFILILTGLPLSFNVNAVNAESSNIEILDVSFGGVFSTEKGYTNPTGEIMDGDLTRRTGNEEIVEGKVVVNGNLDGIDFNPRTTFSVGSEVIDQPVVVEAKFRPDEDQRNLNTIISIGGNLYVRYISATEIEYGFEVNNNGWKSVKQKIAAPEANKEHTIAIAYEPTEDGAILHAFLNGLALPSAVSKNGGAAWSKNSGNEIGFGNDVHASALNRGFKGSFSRAVVTSFEGKFKPSLLKTMRLSSVERSLSVSGLGTLEKTNYVPVGEEIVNGKLEIKGGEISGLGRLNMSGKSSNIAFTPKTSPVDDGLLSGDYIAEIVVAPTAMTPGTVLIDLAGAVKIRQSIEGESIDLLVDNQVKGTVDLPTTLNEAYVHLSLLYRNIGETGAEVSLMLDKEQIGETLALTERPKADLEKVSFAGNEAETDIAGKDLKGEVYGVAFAEIEGDFMADLLSLLGGPCIIPTDLDPGHQISINANECSAALAAKASLVRPEPKQVAWQEYEQTAFIHYGINTYYGVEWGDLWNHDDPKMFNPTDLDTDQWARSLRDGGFKMAVLTVKHHDGFALYPSRYTDFSVKSSPWKDGEGDVLREFVDSMRKYGIKVGVYLSPSDHGAYRDGIFANGSPRSMRTIPTLVKDDDRIGDSTLPNFDLPATDYGAMLLNQLYEVLTEYGEVDEVWFDGAQGNIPGNKEEKYDWDSYYKLINELAPDAVVAVTGDDVRWVGNESGWARENEWSVLGSTRMGDGRQAYHPSFSSPDLGSRFALADAAANGMEYLTWWPAEVDVSIRNGWFYHDNQQPKSIDTLRNIYYQSVARNSVLLLNIPPDKRGQFADADIKRLKDWHKSIKRDFAINHADGAKIEAENGASDANPVLVSDELYDTSWQSASTQPSSLTFKLDENVKVDRVVLQEDINHGQQVESFAIDVREANGEWKEIYANEVIGYKRIASLAKPVTGKEFRVRILKSRGVVHLAEIGLYETLPAGKGMARLSGMETAVAGESFTLKYELSELPKEMPEGVHRQEVTVQYDPEIFKFESVESLNPEEYQIVETEEETLGEIRIIVESKEQLMKKDEQVLKLNWKTQNKVKRTKINVSKTTLIDRDGVTVDGVGAMHAIKVKVADGESVDKDLLRNLIEESQKLHDAAVEGTNVGEYIEGAKEDLNNAIEVAKEVEKNSSATQEEVDLSVSELQRALEKFKSLVNPPSLGAAAIKSLVESLAEEGEFENAQTARALTTHLTAVEQYEKQEAVEKVVKHMKSFKTLLDYQKERKLISDKAHSTLIASADELIKKWQ